MDDLLIQGSDSLPTVHFKTSGELKISGRALPEDAASYFAPLLQWVDQYANGEMRIEVNLDYFNTSVSKQLLDFFKIIEQKQSVSKVQLTWIYEEGDDEMLESGEIYQELLPRFEFSFHRLAEMAD